MAERYSGSWPENWGAPIPPEKKPKPAQASVLSTPPQSVTLGAAPVVSPLSSSRPATGMLGGTPVQPDSQGIRERLRSGYYSKATSRNPDGWGSDRTASSTPAPEDVLAARQRLAATQAGGVPISQARALSQGRQDAASRIANAKGRANLPSYPSPLDGSAAFFHGMNKRAEADRTTADAAWNTKMDKYRASRDMDANNNTIPDRDEAVASKYGNLGITNVNDLSDASAKYRNYLRAYRESGVRGKARAMSFDEFAKELQNQEKQLPAFDLAAAASFVPRERNVPSPERVAAARERSRLNELTVMGQNQGMNPMAARQFALSTLGNERQLTAAQGEAQAQRMAQQGLAETQAGAQTRSAELAANATMGANELRLAEMQANRELAQQQFERQMAALQQQNALQRDRFGLEQRQFDLAANQSVAERYMPAKSAYDEAYAQAYRSAQALGYTDEDLPGRPGAASRARAAAESAWRRQAAQNQMLGQVAGSPIPSDGEMPTSSSYIPDPVDPDLASGATRATPEQITQLVSMYQARNNNRPPTPEELMQIAQSSNLIIDKTAMDRFYDSAQSDRERRFMLGFSPSSWVNDIEKTPGSARAYKDVFGVEPVPYVNPLMRGPATEVAPHNQMFRRKTPLQMPVQTPAPAGASPLR